MRAVQFLRRGGRCRNMVTVSRGVPAPLASPAEHPCPFAHDQGAPWLPAVAPGAPRRRLLPLSPPDGPSRWQRAPAGVRLSTTSPWAGAWEPTPPTPPPPCHMTQQPHTQQWHRAARPRAAPRPHAAPRQRAAARRALAASAKQRGTRQRAGGITRAPQEPVWNRAPGASHKLRRRCRAPSPHRATLRPQRPNATPRGGASRGPHCAREPRKGKESTRGRSEPMRRNTGRGGRMVIAGGARAEPLRGVRGGAEAVERCTAWRALREGSPRLVGCSGAQGWACQLVAKISLRPAATAVP